MDSDTEIELLIKRAVTEVEAPTARMATRQAGAGAIARRLALERHLQSRVPEVADVCERLGRLVKRDGRQHRILALDAVPNALWERLRGRRASPYDAYYELPNTWFVELDRPLPDRFGVPPDRH